MKKLQYAVSFSDLVVYQKSQELAAAIFQVTEEFPDKELYSLTNQIRRSSRSIGAQIAEAWAKRSYEKHFISKLTDADAEAHETQHWILIAADCSYLSETDREKLIELCREIGRLLGGMIAKSKSFCSSSNRTVKEFFSSYPSSDQ